MKDCSQESLESTRPNKDARDMIEFILHRLYLDNQHGIEEEIVGGLTFEELIGALLGCRDEISQLEDCLELEQSHSNDR